MELKKDASLGMIDSYQLALYVAHKCGKLSHLKLQKLLYYVQAYHLAYFDEPLISDDFEAWVHGPVSRKIYEQLGKSVGLYDELVYSQKSDERPITELLRYQLTNEQISLIDDVLTEFAHWTGLELENLIRQEQPWKESRKGLDLGDRCTTPISKESMRVFYKAWLYSEQDKA